MPVKKKRIPCELTYLLGMILMPFSVVLSIKADLGLSMIAAPSYIISERFAFITTGQVEWALQAVFLALMCMIIRRFRLTYLTSFLSALVYGALIDLFRFLLEPLVLQTLPLRIAFFIAGMVLTSLSVALLFKNYLAPCAYDYFVRVVGEVKKLDMRKWKIAYDAGMLLLSVALSLILFRKLVGLSVGTVVLVICNGNIISFFSKWLDKHFEYYDGLPLRKYFDVT